MRLVLWLRPRYSCYSTPASVTCAFTAPHDGSQTQFSSTETETISLNNAGLPNEWFFSKFWGQSQIDGRPSLEQMEIRFVKCSWIRVVFHWSYTPGSKRFCAKVDEDREVPRSSSYRAFQLTLELSTTKAWNLYQLERTRVSEMKLVWRNMQCKVKERLWFRYQVVPKDCFILWENNRCTTIFVTYRNKMDYT